MHFSIANLDEKKSPKAHERQLATQKYNLLRIFPGEDAQAQIISFILMFTMTRLKLHPFARAGGQGRLDEYGRNGGALFAGKIFERASRHNGRTLACSYRSPSSLGGRSEICRGASPGRLTLGMAFPKGPSPALFPVIAGFKALPLSKKRGSLSGFLKLSAMFLIIQIKIYNSSKKSIKFRKYFL